MNVFQAKKKVFWLFIEIFGLHLLIFFGKKFLHTIIQSFECSYNIVPKYGSNKTACTKWENWRITIFLFPISLASKPKPNKKIQNLYQPLLSWALGDLKNFPIVREWWKNLWRNNEKKLGTPNEKRREESYRSVPIPTCYIEAPAKRKGWQTSKQLNGRFDGKAKVLMVYHQTQKSTKLIETINRFRATITPWPIPNTL